MRFPLAVPLRRAGRIVAAIAVLLAVWVTTTGAGHSDIYARPVTLPALSMTTLAARYAANRRSIEQAQHTAERVRDGARARAFAGLLRGGRTFLSFDPRGTGRAVEVIGDLVHAQRVAVLVPGADTSVTAFDRSGHRVYSTPGGAARALYREAAGLGGSARLAVVAWLGYRPPHLVSAAVLTDLRAESGAAGLRRFVAGLRRINPLAGIALLCHSYGSVVCGEAARNLPVSDVAAVGSPGMAASSAAGLHTGARVWAGRGSRDWTRLTPHMRFLGLGFGTDPISRRFGARLFATGPADHSGYFMPGSLSLRNLALIALGRDVRRA